MTGGVRPGSVVMAGFFFPLRERLQDFVSAFWVFRRLFECWF